MVPPISVNILCLCAAVVGIAAIFCGWRGLRSGDFEMTWSISDDILTLPSSGLLAAGEMLFVVGTAAAFSTTLAGFIQASGLVAMFAWYNDISGPITRLGESYNHFLGLGFYVAAASVCLAIASFLVPIGPNLVARELRLQDRLLVVRWGRSDRLGTGSTRGTRSSSRAVRANAKWLAVLVATTLISAVLVVYDNDFYREDPLMTEVQGGVSMEFDNRVLPYFPSWDKYGLSLRDGENSVSWYLLTAGLDGGVRAVLDLGYRSMGPMNISLAAVDELGDGLIGWGDSLVLTTSGDVSFDEDVVYAMYLRTNRTIAWTGVEISFTFEDGDLDSWISDEVRYGL